MNSKRPIIEKMKSITIVVLTMSAILLLCFFWKDIDLYKLSLSDFDLGGTEYTRETFVKDVLLPDYAQISTSDGSCAIVKNPVELFGENGPAGGLGNALGMFFNSSEIFVEDITKEQYDSVNEYEAIKLVFGYDIPLDEYCAYFGHPEFSGVEQILNVSEISLSSIARDSVLIYDEPQDKCFRLVAEKNYSYIIEFLEEVDMDSLDFYYTMNEFMGEQVDNNLMLPLYLSPLIEESNTHSEFTIDDEKIVNQTAKSFFGSTFDFARKIQETSGRITYIYGYGDNVLIFDKDGSIEYKAELQGNEMQNRFEALETALIFIDSHNIAGKSQEPSLRLRSIETNPEGNKGYRFVFSLDENGTELFEESKAPVIIDVIGGKVTYYFRKVPKLEVSGSEYQEAYSAINTIANNYSYIISQYPEMFVKEDKNGKPVNSSEDDVASKIKSMEYGYLDYDGKLAPVWRIGIKGAEDYLYFDLLTAEPLTTED